MEISEDLSGPEDLITALMPGFPAEKWSGGSNHYHCTWNSCRDMVLRIHPLPSYLEVLQRYGPEDLSTALIPGVSAEMFTLVLI